MPRDVASWSDEDLIEELLAIPAGLTDWEVDFLECVARVVQDDGKVLTHGQRQKCVEILEART